MAQVRLLLIVGPGRSREAYERALRVLGARFDTVDTVAAIKSALAETPYNGLLLDVPTMIKAGNREKALVHELLERFPVLRLIHDPQADEVRGLYYGHTIKDGTSLEQFVTVTCAGFIPRSIRVAKRVHKVFNVLLLDDPDMPLERAEQAVTFNISAKGCFVLTPRPWLDQDRVFLVFHDLEERTPVEASIRWRVAWGESMRLPGMGVSFVDLEPDLEARLEAML